MKRHYICGDDLFCGYYTKEEILPRAYSLAEYIDSFEYGESAWHSNNPSINLADFKRNIECFTSQSFFYEGE